MSRREPHPGMRLPPGELRTRLDFDDARLLGECEVQAHRVRGPGGQHRNKVETAIRLVHRPSGLVVTGTERRSQSENKAAALRRLREAIALSARASLPERVVWPDTVQIQDARLRVNDANPALPHVFALVLDALAACAGDHKPAAERLGVTPSSLVKFLADHPKCWREVARIRQAAGLPPLKNPR